MCTKENTMQPLIIIEGLDRCGKSTTVDHIRKKIITSPKTVTIHSSAPPKAGYTDRWSYDHYKNLISHSTSMMCASTTVIHDRSYIGEYVYGPIYRKSNPYWIFENSKYGNSLESNLLHDNTYLILLTDTIENRLIRDDGLSLSSDRQKMLKEEELFLEAFNKSSIKNKIHIHNQPLSEMIKMVDIFMRGINV